MKSTNLTSYLLIALFTFCGIQASLAQPGMYHETDIEFQSLFMDAIIAKTTGDTEKQIESLQEIIRRDKTADAAYYELARVYQAQSNFELAQKNAQKACANNSTNHWYKLLLADIYESSKQYNKASGVYKELIQMGKDNEEVYHKLAYNQLMDKKPDAAISTLKDFESDSGINEETSRRIFDIYNKTGKKEKALQTLQALSDKYPEDVRLLNNLAAFMHDVGKREEANVVFQKVLKLDPTNSQASMALVKKDIKKSEAPNYLRSLSSVMQNMNIPLDNKIQELMPYLSHMNKNGETTSALVDISASLVELYPTNAKVYAVRGDVLFYSGDFKNAEKAYSKAISIDDRKYSLWDQWMLNLWELEEKQKLYDVSYDAVDLFPNQVHAFIFHAIALSLKEDTAEATALLYEAKLIAGKNEMLKTKVTVAETWINIPSLSKTEIKDKLKGFNLKTNTNSIFFEFVGDIYQVISENTKSKEFWAKAIELGGNESRLKKKIGA